MSNAMNTVYKKKNFKVYSAGKEFIVHNSKLNFSGHHTHINNFDTCKYIINLCIHKTVPRHLSDYLLVSIIKLSTDKEYIKSIESKLEENKYKKNRHKYNIKRKVEK